MDQSWIPFLLVGGGALFGALATYAVMVTRRTDMPSDLPNLLKAMSAEALHSNNQQFLTLATENLKQFQQQAEQKLTEKQTAIATMLQPVSETLQKMDGKIAEIESKREGAYAELRSVVNAMKDQHILLHKQTSSLAQTLRAPTSRGQWGEMHLEQVLEISGLQKGVHYERQATSSSGLRPDIIISLPPDKQLLVDSKVPLLNYQMAMEDGISDEDKHGYLSKHANDLKDHIKKLSEKEYTKDFNSFDFVVLYLPLEGLIQMALDKQSDLLEYAWRRKIVLATPTNLLALTRTVAFAHDQFKVNENAREISDIGNDLYSRIMTFAGHFSGLEKNLNMAVESYNKAVGSLERNVMPGMRRLNEMGVGKNETKDKIPSPIDNNARKISNVITADETLEA
jgi:DNA recombination protein RmuC